MRSNRSHLGSRHLALEPGRVRYSVVKGKAAGRSTMPGLHGCKECCVGCQLRRCCLPRSPSRHPWPELKPHLCEHCLTQVEEWKLTLEQLRFHVAQIRSAHAMQLRRQAELKHGRWSTPSEDTSSDESPWTSLASPDRWAFHLQCCTA